MNTRKLWLMMLLVSLITVNCAPERAASTMPPATKTPKPTLTATRTPIPTVDLEATIQVRISEAVETALRALPTDTPSGTVPPLATPLPYVDVPIWRSEAIVWNLVNGNFVAESKSLFGSNQPVEVWQIYCAIDKALYPNALLVKPSHIFEDLEPGNPDVSLDCIQRIEHLDREGKIKHPEEGIGAKRPKLYYQVQARWRALEAICIASGFELPVLEKDEIVAGVSAASPFAPCIKKTLELGFHDRGTLPEGYMLPWDATDKLTAAIWIFHLHELEMTEGNSTPTPTPSLTPEPTTTATATP